MIFKVDEFMRKVDELMRDKHIKEDQEYINNLNDGLIYLEEISNKLITCEINVKQKPWYKNIIEIYVPKAQKYGERCNAPNFDISKANDIWIRSEYKSFLSEVEKFIKFFIYETLGLDKDNFSKAINEFNNVVSEYKERFNQDWESEMLEIKDNLHRWRINYNENKHDKDKMDDCSYIENETCTVLGDDILEYVSDFICKILCPLLETLLIIKTK